MSRRALWVGRRLPNGYAAPIGAFFVLKFVRSRGFGVRFLQPFHSDRKVRFKHKNGR